MKSLAPQHPLAFAKAAWYPDAPKIGPVWMLFRNELLLEEPVEASRFWWSASQRARIWLDGQLISEGPPRSDRELWPYVEVDLPALEKGTHMLAVEVVHYGPHAGKGQIGGLGFWVCASENAALAAWQSDAKGWRCLPDPSRHFWQGDLGEEDAVKLGGHRCIGDGHVYDASLMPATWRAAGFDASAWQQPETIWETHNNHWGNRSFGCHLVESFLPRMEQVPLELKPLDAAMTLLPPNGVKANCWIGVAEGVVNADISLRWLGGEGARITLTYCESAIDAEARRKDRDPNAERSAFPGQQDQVICDGDGEWSVEWIRSFRYLVIDVELADRPLQSLDLRLIRRAMPLEDTLEFNVEDGRDWSALSEVNRRTIRACSHETFFDCPGWEQAQFPGDARIQVRQHYIGHNEERLALKAIADLAASRTPSGLLRSHWPSSFEQVISTYSLQWVGMLYDFYWYRGKTEPLKRYLPVARGILDYFIALKREDGLLGRVAEAPFMDWAFKAGCAPQAEDGGSSILTAMVAEACEWIVELEKVCGYPELAERWQREGELFRGALQLCLDSDTGLLRDFPDGDFSVHAQVQAALAGFGSLDEAGERIVRAMAAEDCQQVNTLYYRAFVMEALRKCGLQQKSIELLDFWFGFLEKGARTWPENDRDNARSDCHGWGCVPEVEAVHSLFGLAPAEPGWSRISFKPNVDISLAASLQIQLPSGLLKLEKSAKCDWKIDAPVPVNA